MKMVAPLLAALVLVLAGCEEDTTVAPADTKLPPLNEIAETPGDWSLLNVLVDRHPDGSELLVQSPISIDLNAMVGPAIFDYRQRMAAAGPLTRDGDLLYSVTPPGPNAAYLIIDPDQRAIAAGWKKDGKWHVQHTAGADMRNPRPVQVLLTS